MIKIKNEGIILKKTELKFENYAVLNPAVIEVGGITHMFYRAIGATAKDIHHSSIGYCQLINNKVIKRRKTPILKTEFAYEKNGLEDPRIVCINKVYYLFYTVYDGTNAIVAYATSHDLTSKFKKQSFVLPRITHTQVNKFLNNTEVGKKYQKFKAIHPFHSNDDQFFWEKNVVLFPRKINNKFALIHRVLPGLQIIYFDSFKQLTLSYWQKYLKNIDKYVMFYPKYTFENRHIGGGCPPIETKAGWLLIYHAVEISNNKNTYHACAALLDLDDPTKLISRLSYPLFSPITCWEQKGVVSNVVFPTGAIVKGDLLHIYYGAADHVIAAKSVNLQELLDELLNTAGP
jgi:beta-1,2-mannobiose phosphorylase / 1,2-beta-oligomannan phosphorylase